MDHNKTCDKICKWNTGIERICETEIVSNWKILRKMFGATKETDGAWRFITNDELNNLINNNYIIN